MMLKNIALVSLLIQSTLVGQLFADVATRGSTNDQTQALIQQLGMERTRLTAENAKLKRQVKELEEDVEILTDKKDKTDKKLNSVRAS